MAANLSRLTCRHAACNFRAASLTVGGGMALRDVLSRRERILFAILIVTGFAAWMSLGYLFDTPQHPRNCLTACATSGQMVATREAVPLIRASSPPQAPPGDQSRARDPVTATRKPLT